MRKNNLVGIHTSHGLASGYEHNSRTESKSYTGFYLFVAGLVAGVAGLVSYFM